MTTESAIGRTPWCATRPVVAVNDPRDVREPREALTKLLALPAAGGLADRCSGLPWTRPLGSHEVAATPRRLVGNTLSYVPDRDIPFADPGDRELLDSGKFERWLAEM